MSSHRYSRPSVAIGALVLTVALSGVAIAAVTSGHSTTINGCYNSSTGALRVLTKAHPSCGSEQKLSWNQTGPAGDGYHFTTMSGGYNRFGQDEADGPTILKAGTYFIDVNADVRITSAGPIQGQCALDVTSSAQSIDFKIFSPLVWTIAFPPDNDVYPASISGLVTITSSDVKHPLTYGCDTGATALPTHTSRWWISPVSASTASTASVSTMMPRP